MNDLHSLIVFKVYFTDANLENYNDTILNNISAFSIPSLFWCPRMKIIILFHLMCLCSNGNDFLSPRLEIVKPRSGSS